MENKEWNVKDDYWLIITGKNEEPGIDGVIKINEWS